MQRQFNRGAGCRNATRPDLREPWASDRPRPLGKECLRSLIFCTVSVVLTSGCVVWQGPASPDLAATHSEEKLEITPIFKIYLQSSDDFELETVQESSNQALKNVINESSLMANTKIYSQEPVNYVLFLHTWGTEPNQALAVISGLTFMLIPVFPHFEHGVTGVLYEASSGEFVGVYKARRTVRMAMWLPLLPFSPISLISMLNSDIDENKYRDLFIQISRDLSEDLKDRSLPETAYASLSKIEQRREFRERKLHFNR